MRGKFIAIQADLKKKEKSQINVRNLHLKGLEKHQTKSTVRRKKEKTIR